MHAFQSGARRRALTFLLLAASLLAPALADAQVTGGGRRRACSDCEAERRRERALERLDSLRWEFEHEKLTDVQRERIRKEMSVAVRELQAAIGDLRVEMGDIDRAHVEAIAAPRITYSYARRPSHGYLGVTFDGPNTEELRGDERMIRFLAYPRIQLVEPSSPAERAGIRIGDTLVAMNGLDLLEQEISLTKLLVPDAPLALRLRREGALREMRVIVGRPPAYIVQRRTAPEVVVAGEAAGGVTTIRTSPTPRGASGGTVTPRSPARLTAGVWVVTDGVAGAKVETVSEGLGRALGVDGGVLVLRAGPATPALRAGLRDGDIIVRAGGVRVNTVRELREALQKHDDGDGVKLVILREKKQRELTLRQ